MSRKARRATLCAVSEPRSSVRPTGENRVHKLDIPLPDADDHRHGQKSHATLDVVTDGALWTKHTRHMN